MARISLRAYNRDIEVMIDKNQIDEAFAHCRYILQLYPKHINTYRLMGKALLEAQRFSDAADVFHRVLSSIPDDFIAHLGMSIIREDESNLDAAIWHMERSFEVQPSNAAVQVELRRLYGLRDGVTPQKIQLTRGALARMSAKSNLHSQAIAELRAALSNDPQRPDLQVVLAEMYRQTGARMEAIETCNALINKLPYCLTANRILAELLPETERADQSHVYKTRLGELDPYYLQISPVAPTLDQVPDGAVTIERFEYSGESYPTSEKEQPSWAASLGVDLDQQAEDEEPSPDWLVESKADSKIDQIESQEEDLASISEFEASPDIEEFPDWMTDMDETDEASASLPVAEESGALTNGDSEIEESWAESSELDAPQDAEQTPDWLDAEQEVEEQVEEEGESAQFDTAAAAAVGAFIATQGEEEEEPQPANELEFEQLQDELPAKDEVAPLPDWMQEAEQLDEGEFQTDSPGSAPEIPSEEEPSEFVLDEEETPAEPEWMSAVGETTADTPDWLRDAMESTDEEEIAGTPSAAAFTAAEAVLGADDNGETAEESPTVTDQQLVEESLEAGTFEEQPDEDRVSAGEAVLGGLAAGAVLGEVLETDGDETDSGVEQDIPEWLTDLGEDLPEPDLEAAPAAIFEDQPTGDEELEEIMVSTNATGDSEDLVAAAEDEDLLAESISSYVGEDSEDREFPESIPDWLSEVSPDEIPEEVLESEQELNIVRAEIPIWLKKMEAQHQAEMAAETEVDRIEDIELETEFTQLSGEDVPTWLMSAMEPELAEEGIAAESVDDISEVFEEMGAVEVDEIGLAADVTGDLPADESETEPSFDELQAELASTDTVEAVEEQELIEPLESVEEIATEESLVAQEQDLDTADQDSESFSMTELAAAAAAGAVAAHIAEDEEDTQPVVVREEGELLSEPDTDAAIVETLSEEEIEIFEPTTEFPEPLEAAEEEELPPTPETEVAETPAFAADVPLSSEDEDAAMAWLESLAAKQGAAEEELLTPADQRLEEPPEWVQEEISDFEGEEEEEDEARHTALTAAALAGITAGMLDEDEPAAVEDEQVDLEEPLEEPSEWIPEVIADETTDMAEEAVAIEEESDLVPESLEMDEEPDFIEEMAAAAEVDLEQVETQETPGEIPGWLSGLAEDQAYGEPSEDIEWTPDMVVEEIEVTGEMVDSAEVLKLDVNAASLSQLEKIPGIGFITAQNIVNHRSAHGSFTDLEQLNEVEGISPDLVADLEDYLTVAVVAEVLTTESDNPELQQAWEQVDQGNIDQAVGKYNELIEAGQHLDEVIRDLHSALNKYPRDSSLYQTLGDAYMRTNMLQEALDAYNRAEDLI